VVAALSRAERFTRRTVVSTMASAVRRWVEPETEDIAGHVKGALHQLSPCTKPACLKRRPNGNAPEDGRVARPLSLHGDAPDAAVGTAQRNACVLGYRRFKALAGQVDRRAREAAADARDDCRSQHEGARRLSTR
jgi:hypothetical protein